jgi:hypothetical protein
VVQGYVLVCRYLSFHHVQVGREALHGVFVGFVVHADDLDAFPFRLWHVFFTAGLLCEVECLEDVECLFM